MQAPFVYKLDFWVWQTQSNANASKNAGFMYQTALKTSLLCAGYPVKMGLLQESWECHRNTPGLEFQEHIFEIIVYSLKT